MHRVFNKKIFLDELPTKIYKGTKSIDWDKCIGYKIKFIYDDIEDFIIIDKIIHIKNKENKILIKYKNSDKIKQEINKLLETFKFNNVVNVKINVDPYDF